MLQQFTRFKNLAGDAASQPEKVAYPLVYRFSKDDRTHHVLGWIHGVPLDVMPSWVQAIIDNSSGLLTESMIAFSDDIKQAIRQDKAHIFWEKLGEHKQAFIDSLEKTAQILNINIEETAPEVLLKLFFNRHGEDRIDDACIRRFMYAKKDVKEFNHTKDIVTGWLAESKVSKKNAFYWRIRANLVVSKLNDQCNSERSMDDINAVQKIKDFMTLDLAQQTPPELDQPLQDYYDAQNKNWFQTLLDCHHSLKDKLLLGCGYSHLFGDHGLLALGKKAGFAVEKLNPSPEHRLTAQMASFSLGSPTPDYALRPGMV